MAKKQNLDMLLTRFGCTRGIMRSSTPVLPERRPRLLLRKEVPQQDAMSLRRIMYAGPEGQIRPSSLWRNSFFLSGEAYIGDSDDFAANGILPVEGKSLPDLWA